MNTYNDKLSENVFLATDDNLIEVKLLKETLTFETATYEYEHNGAKHSIDVERNSNRFYNLFYESVANYQDRVSIKPLDRHFYWNYKRIEETESMLLVHAFVFENNTAVAKDVQVERIVCERGHSNVVTLADGIDAYRSAEECLAYNKIVATNISGKDISNDTGYMKDLLTFNDEQLKAIEELKAAIKKVGETCTFVCSWKGLSVINGEYEVMDKYLAEDNGYEYKLLYSLGIDLPYIYANYTEGAVIIEK